MKTLLRIMVIFWFLITIIMAMIFIANVIEGDIQSLRISLIILLISIPTATILINEDKKRLNV